MSYLIAWGPALVWAAVLFLLSGLSSVPRVPALAVHDELVHLGLYFVLGAALAWGKEGSPREVPHWLPLAAGLAYGAVDEWHQSFVPRRYPSWGDFGMDGLGILLGYAIFLFVWSRAFRTGVA